MNDSPSTPEDNLLVVSNLSVTFPGSTYTINAVKGISFDLKKGEILALVGESGSGKSTTVMSICKLFNRTSKPKISGSVSFSGIDLLALSDSQLNHYRGKRIAYIFQDPATSLNPVFKIKTQIKEWCRKLNIEWNPSAIENRLAEVGLDQAKHLLSAYPSELSGGMLQRISIFMALLAEPELLIADEPTSALDAHNQINVVKILKQIPRKHQTSILFVTHDIAQLNSLADRILVMNDGKVVEIGSTQNILGNPQDPYTQKLIDSIPKRLRKIL